MAEPFKLLVDRAAVSRLAAAILRVYPAFDAPGFVAKAADGLDPLELKARVQHVARALRAALPADWARAAAILVASLPPALPDESGLSGGIALWPLLQVVEDYGRDLPEVSLPALKEMTRRFSAEFAIRPFLVEHPTLTGRTLDTWVTDPDVHVRRLVSEGTRPRLPWGGVLRAAIADPTPGLERIARLVDDPSPYVRRSVANHLGDVAKDHPALAVAVAARWMAEDPSRRPLVLHALRTPLKRGDPAALALLGYAPGSIRVTELALDRDEVTEGDVLTVSARIGVDAPATVRVDVVWTWPGARGRGRRVFNAGSRDLAPGETWAFRHRLHTRPVTTRRPAEGTHTLVLRVQGQDQPPLPFTFRRG